MNSVDGKLRAPGRIALAAATLLLPFAAHGATIPVGCAADQLRTAITTANSAAGADVLQLAPACTYMFTTVDNAWYGPNALPPIASDITIEGNGATLLVAAGGPPSLRFFYVSGGLSPPRGTSSGLPPGVLTLHNLTLQSGQARGGGSGYGGGGAGMGGAIFNQGNVTLIADTLAGNQAIGGSTGLAAQYGGGGMGADAAGTSGGGFGASFGTYGGVGGSGAPIASGGGGGFSANGGSGYGLNAGGGNSAWGGSGYNAPVTSGEGGAGAGISVGGGSGGDGGSFGAGGTYVTSAGGGGGVGGGGGGNSSAISSYGGGGGFGGGGGGAFYPGTGGFGGGGGGGGESAAGGYGGGGGAGGGGAGMGGAIFNLNGTLTLIDCTLSGNQAIGGTSGVGGGNGAGLGGAIFNLQGSVAIRDSTLAYNSASGAAGSTGGAVYNVGYLAGDDGGTLSSASTITLANSILSNSTDGAIAISDLASDAPSTLAGGYANIAFATVTLDSTDIVMRTTNLGNSNVIGAPSTNDPLLGPLQNNGGPTMTMALSSLSPAIDNGSAAGAPATDQRGCPRISGAAPDIGAYELFDTADIVFRDGFEAVAACL